MDKKDLNNIDSLLSRYNKDNTMSLTKTEIKILHKINENKEGVLLVNLAKATKIDRGNLSNYVNGLISKGIVQEISKNPKLVKIVKLSYLHKLNIVKCSCNNVVIIPKTINYFKCKKCKKMVIVNKHTTLQEMEEETYEKLTGLCYMHNKKSFKELIDYLWLNNKQNTKENENETRN